MSGDPADSTKRGRDAEAASNTEEDEPAETSNKRSKSRPGLSAASSSAAASASSSSVAVVAASNQSAMSGVLPVGTTNCRHYFRALRRCTCHLTDQVWFNSLYEDDYWRRTTQPMSLTAPDPSVAAAIDGAAPTFSFTVLSRGFPLLRLAVVERQLIMQGLDFRPLVWLASTCRQLHRESLHPNAGKFLRESKWGGYSPLFRAHARVQLDLTIHQWHDEGLRPMLAFLKTAPPMHILECYNIDKDEAGVDDDEEAGGGVVFTEEWWQWMLSHRLTQVRSLKGRGRAIASLMSPALQPQLFALPSLTELKLCLTSGWSLIQTAVAQAASLSCLDLSIEDSSTFKVLSHVPALQTLALSGHPRSPIALRDGLPSTLTSLTLGPIVLPLLKNAEGELDGLFRRVPHLQVLKLWSVSTLPMLRGVIAARAAHLLQQLNQISFGGLDPADEQNTLVELQHLLSSILADRVRVELNFDHDEYTPVRHSAFAAFRTWGEDRGLTIFPCRPSEPSWASRSPTFGRRRR